MSNSPLFSIITITFNAEETLPVTLKSIADQTFHDFEQVIVDGKSTDRTLSICNKMMVHGKATLVSEPDNGLYDAMNKGLKIARGKYLIFLNAGDTFHGTDTLQTIADAIGNDSPDIVYGQTDIVNSKRQKIANRHLSAPEDLSFDSFKNGMLVCHQAFVAKRELAEKYNLDYRYSADYDWCIRILQKAGLNRYIPCTLIDYLSEGVTTANFGKSLRERFRIMCRYYGTIPTMLRHIKFLLRHLSRKIKH